MTGAHVELSAVIDPGLDGFVYRWLLGDMLLDIDARRAILESSVVIAVPDVSIEFAPSGVDLLAGSGAFNFGDEAAWLIIGADITAGVANIIGGSVAAPPNAPAPIVDTLNGGIGTNNVWLTLAPYTGGYESHPLHYYLDRSLGALGPWTQIHEVSFAGENYNATGLTDYTDYYWRSRIHDAITGLDSPYGALHTQTLPIPIASYTVAPSSFYVGETVFFTDTSHAPQGSWSWVVDAIEVATTQNLDYNFPDTALHSVELIIASGASGYVENFIAIRPTAGTMQLTPSEIAFGADTVAELIGATGDGLTYYLYIDTDTPVAGQPQSLGHDKPGDASYTVNGYVIDVYGNQSDVVSAVLSIDSSGGMRSVNNLPRVILRADNTVQVQPSNPNDLIAHRCEIDWGDGQVDLGYGAPHRYSEPGEYGVRIKLASRAHESEHRVIVRILP